MIKIGTSNVKNKPFRVDTGGYLTLSNGVQMYIPKGYVFDNGSIPKPLKWLYDTFGWEFLNYKQKAFLIHDYMYNYRSYRLSRGNDSKIVSRDFADREMIHWMKVHGDTKTKIAVWYIFVRVFGWLFFGRI